MMEVVVVQLLMIAGGGGAHQVCFEQAGVALLGKGGEGRGCRVVSLLLLMVVMVVLLPMLASPSLVPGM